MKRFIRLSLCVLLLTQACKKDTVAVVKPPVKNLPGDGVIVIPDLPVGTPPVNGEAPPADEPVTADIVYRMADARLGYNKPVFLDINDDSRVDFTFSSVLIAAGGKPYLYLLVSTKSGSGNKVLVQNGPEQVINGLYIPALEKNDGIGDILSAQTKWTEIGQKGFLLGVSETETTKDQYGLWINKINKYLGVQVQIDGEIHYGWVQLSHDNVNDEMLVSGFAYHKTAGSAIRAGQK